MAQEQVVGNKKIAIVTICSNNYMANARTLLDSVRLHHPEADRFLCLVDAPFDMEGLYPDDCQIMLARDLGIPDFEIFAFQYNVVEMNTAVKPFVLLRLFEQDYDKVIYFDPDIELFRPLASVCNALESGASFVLTPHLCLPADDDWRPNDINMMQAGIYNLGFLACGRQADTEPLLRWWARRLHHQCVTRTDLGLFQDQKFMDLIPGFSDNCRILRDPTLNVAYWNLSQRSLQRDGRSWFVDNHPLTFFHFSGFEPGNMTLLSKHTNVFRGEHIPASIKEMMIHYKQRLIENGYGKLPNNIYAYSRFASGTLIPEFARRMFRERHLPWSGNPFENYEEFLHHPALGVSRNSSSYIVTNLMKFMWDEHPWMRGRHIDLQSDEQVEGYVRWYVENGPSVLRMDPRLVEPVAARAGRRRYPSSSKISSNSRQPRPDVSVVGYLKTASGVGEAGRQTLRALSTTDLMVEGHDVEVSVVAARDEASCDEFLSPTASGRVQVFNINADQLPLVLERHQNRLAGDAYRIAVPFWELAEFPQVWYPALQAMDEIWAPSRFIQTALFRKIRMPITYMPIALWMERPPALGREYFNLPRDKYLFFFSFDFLSFQERKNPRGLYRAFRKAFRGDRSDKPVGLVIKSLNGHHVAGDLADLHAELADDPQVTLIDRTFTRAEILGLMNACDCVVSLHRSEGLGFTVAEAMMLGKPVISTDYAGTTEFVTPATGYPVGYRLIPVQDGQYPHAAGEWADPDLEHAAWIMRRVCSNEAEVAEKVWRAKQHIEQQHGIARIGALQRERLQEIGLHSAETFSNRALMDAACS